MKASGRDPHTLYVSCWRYRETGRVGDWALQLSERADRISGKLRYDGQSAEHRKCLDAMDASK